MKAVIVIDMPDDMEIKDTKALHITLFNGLFTRDISINCPIKTLPQKTYAEFPDPYKYGFADGWNRCLEEIKK